MAKVMGTVPDYMHRKEPKRVNMEVKKAENGYVICSYDDKGETLVIAKDKKEAKQIMQGMMNKTKI